MNITINNKTGEITLKHTCDIEDILDSIPMSQITKHVSDMYTIERIIDVFGIELIDFKESEFESLDLKDKKLIICNMLGVNTHYSFEDVAKDIKKIFENRF